MRRLLAAFSILIAAVAAVFLAVFVLRPSSPVLVPTTNVTIEPPAGYRASKRFPGIEDTGADGSFTVNIFPAQAVESLGTLFGSLERAKPTLNNRGIAVEGTETIVWNGGEVLLFHGTQKNEEGVLYEKWIAVFIDERPVMVAFQEPRPGKLSKDAIVKAFSSVAIDKSIP